MRISDTSKDAAGRSSRALSLGGGTVVAYPEATTMAARRVMRGNRSEDTRPEVLLRSELHRRGLRFRKHMSIRTDSRSVRPDIVFTRPRLAIFVDGCFWHSCPAHGTRPRGNQSYWAAKLERNRERDAATGEALQRSGWEVIRIWEHEAVDSAAAMIEQRVGRHAG